MHGTRRGCTGALLQPPHTARMAYSRNTALASSDQTPRDQPREAGIHSIAPTSHATPLPAALEMEKILGLLAQLPAQVLSPTPYALKARTLHPWSVEGVRTRWLMHQVYLHYLVSTFSHSPCFSTRTGRGKARSLGKPYTSFNTTDRITWFSKHSSRMLHDLTARAS